MWDVVLALTAVALSLRVLSVADPAPGSQAADASAYALTAVGAGMTMWARRQPLAALAVTGLCVTALTWRDYPVDVLPFLMAGMLFMVASYRPRWQAVLALALTAGFLALSAASQPPGMGAELISLWVVIFAAPWGLGLASKARRGALLGLVSAAEDRAASERLLAAAERDRHALVAMEERLRIARELHDVLAHSISVISVQATVGEHLARSDPAAARRALLTIGHVSRTSMQELRQMLTLLRDESVHGDAIGTTEAAYEPARGLSDLELLLDTYLSAGLHVDMSTSGTARSLSTAADLCAYRIVQEALTNTLKHAGPATASVELRYDDDALRVVISDDGWGSAELAVGNGLVGMRERTALLGGRLDVETGPEGGFTVTASIPYESTHAETVR
jgi:signal transduction histidine kinase